jgi:endonuclease/exonuclease/phosphatase family metal-dependent hydrolase
MPFYTSLQINPSDSQAYKAKKRRVAANLKKLKAALKQHFADSGTQINQPGSLKLATWNLREFGSGKLGGRGFEELYYIAEIISHFELVALQEIRTDLNEFYSLRRILGSDWTFLATDVTDGPSGNNERMVFLYQPGKVKFRNIAGELTLPEGGKIRAAFGERILLSNGLQVNLPQGANLSGTYDARLKSSSAGKKLDADLEIPLPAGSTLTLPVGCQMVVTKNTPVVSPGRGRATVTIPPVITGDTYRLRLNDNSLDDSLRQFARTPFLLSFQVGWLKINLCTVHIYYGDASDPNKLRQRTDEIRLIAKALADKAKTEFAQDKESFLCVLGDFNIIGKDHPTMAALESHDFLIPEQIKSIPGSNVAKDKAYDQIAFWNPKRKTRYAKLEILGANVFDFFEEVFRDQDEAVYRNEDDNGLKPSSSYQTWRTYKLSDHLPMWIELCTDFGEDYLNTILEE